MSSDSQVEYANPVRNPGQPIADSDRVPPKQPPADQRATVIVRGEAVREQPANANAAPGKPKAVEAKKEISAAKKTKQSHLPALDDDGDIGVEKEHTVIRDDQADLTFTGRLLASAAPTPTGDDKWEEYRVYDTTGGKHVFSKVMHSVYVKEPDHHAAEVYDPAPSSVPSQLLRSARDLTRSRPLDWTDAAVSFFGYNPLAKALYRKLGSQFDEHIS
jgi:hypothetical protein